MSFRQSVKEFLRNWLHVNVELLKPGRPQDDGRYSYQCKMVDFGIAKGEKVLDVGSGHNPFPLATHLVDLYEGETTHRAARIKTNGLPLTVCNIEKMPFGDREFDYVYCSHVLEHVDDPGAACRELMRVGKRGYIETPTKTSDIMFNFTKIKNHHKWHVQILGSTIVFFEWKDSEMRDLGSDYFFEQVHSKWKNPLQTLFFENRDMFVNFMQWSGRFDYVVFGKNGEMIDCTLPAGRTERR